MIKVHRASERLHVKNRSRELWMTFGDQDAGNPSSRGFRGLDVLNEIKLKPGRQFELPAKSNQEIVTYVREGCLMFRQPPGRDEFLGPGCCQRASSQPLMLTGGTNESPFRGARLFVSSLTPHQSQGEPSREHRHYPFSDRRGFLRLIASPDGSDASLRLQEDVRIYSSVLDSGHHIVYELGPGRGAWLHVIEGRIRLVDQNLGSGDGASLDDESAVSFTAQESSEILMFDLA